MVTRQEIARIKMAMQTIVQNKKQKIPPTTNFGQTN